MEQKLHESRGLPLLHHIPRHQDVSTSHYGHVAPDSFWPHPVHCRMLAASWWVAHLLPILTNQNHLTPGGEGEKIIPD